MGHKWQQFALAKKHKTDVIIKKWHFGKEKKTELNKKALKKNNVMDILSP